MCSHDYGEIWLLCDICWGDAVALRTGIVESSPPSLQSPYSTRFQFLSARQARCYREKTANYKDIPELKICSSRRVVISNSIDWIELNLYCCDGVVRRENSMHPNSTKMWRKYDVDSSIFWYCTIYHMVSILFRDFGLGARSNREQLGPSWLTCHR